ncbi:hypothetical protein GUITHDRAFT_117679 [Guillardia theta CCMP2712]|uniref:Uncharacterized protein n=1 Tax=Guillardia theta (strain CCMP2712) TaxID=905079 RepID=L1IIU9_GUITC|nr:hypothetical protein GUITHDRAFT_117679 [Guillardia theta CCMP2712]EKX36161.1 hypothetical protein GUITHDRAFT_117679 [Guillardia theta CCMP2712]|eukprot:XP_005823141.1 hypothetical protein GUITHDRAFT_117679 [Guillardia theta CCMP2712]
MFAYWIFKEPYQHIFQCDEACKATDDKIRAVDKKENDFNELLDMMNKGYIYCACDKNTLSEEDREYYDHRKSIIKEYFTAKLEAYQAAMACLKKHMKTLSVTSNAEELKNCTKLETEFDNEIIRYSIKVMEM